MEAALARAPQDLYALGLTLMDMMACARMSQVPAGPGRAESS